MIGLGAVVLPLYLYALWVTRKKGVGTVPESKLLKNVAVWSILAPFFGIALGWIFTEMGRQPFVVAPNLQGDPSIHLFTAAAISPGVSGEEILFSLLTLGLLYGVLMVVEVYLLSSTSRPVCGSNARAGSVAPRGRVQRQVQARCAGVRLLGG